jgi:hypothetical protein
LCIHLGIYDNIGFDVVHKTTHTQIVSLSSKKDANIPEIQIGFVSVDDKNKFEKQLRSIAEVSNRLSRLPLFSTTNGKLLTLSGITKRFTFKWT